jgi:CRISPR/Cas system-associated exonuclease Cas4 (RecB family)
VTALETYRRCPKSYFYLYEMGYPQNLYEEIDLEGEGDDGNFPKREFGILVHSLLERWDFRNDPKREIEKLLKSLRETFSPELRGRIRQAVSSVVSSSLSKEMRRSRAVYRELPFLYRTGRIVFRGAIDLLYQDPRGEWVLVDYKTSSVGKGQVSETAKEYELQMAVYALAVEEALGKFPERTLLFFTTPGEAHRVEWNEARLARVRAFMEEASERILGKEFALNRGLHCEVCPFKTVCFRDYPASQS